MEITSGKVEIFTAEFEFSFFAKCGNFWSKLLVNLRVGRRTAFERNIRNHLSDGRLEILVVVVVCGGGNIMERWVGQRTFPSHNQCTASGFDNTDKTRAKKQYSCVCTLITAQHPINDEQGATQAGRSPNRAPIYLNRENNSINCVCFDTNCRENFANTAAAS